MPTAENWYFEWLVSCDCNLSILMVFSAFMPCLFSPLLRFKIAFDKLADPQTSIWKRNYSLPWAANSPRRARREACQLNRTSQCQLRARMLRRPLMQVLCITRFSHHTKRNLRCSKMKFVPLRKNSTKIGNSEAHLENSPVQFLKGRLSRAVLALSCWRHALCLNPVAKTRKSSNVYVHVMALLLHTCIYVEGWSYRFTQFRFHAKLVHCFVAKRKTYSSHLFSWSRMVPAIFTILLWTKMHSMPLKRGWKTCDLQVHLRLPPFMMLVQ